MRLLITVMFLSLIYFTSGKNNVKSLTESLGQEVIEIGGPIKELPMGLEEEPSAEVDDEEKVKVTNTPQPTTKKEYKKTTTLADVKKNMRDIEKIDAITQDDEEARIEKELAEIYKDTADYKADSAEDKEVAKEEEKVVTKEEKKVTKEVKPVTKPVTPVKEPVTSDAEQVLEDLTSDEESSQDKPIGRQRNNFKFQPDTTDKADIERFRTSIDEISCNNRQKLSGTPAPSLESSKNRGAFNTINNGITAITTLLCCIFICT